MKICGNTSSASIPILLDEMNQKKLLHDGDKIIIAGFTAEQPRGRCDYLEK